MANCDVVVPMQWAKLKDLHDCEPLSDADVECMKDVREVLEKHGKLNRFSLHMIHKHFDLADDEILVEYSDTATREQFFKVEKLGSDNVKHAIPTTWSLGNIEPMASCVCAYRTGQGHLGRHETGIASVNEINKSIA